MSFSITEIVSANKVFVGPAYGIAKLPSFRALTANDIPNLTLSYEANLGVPPIDGYVLSSTVAGVRSWVAPGGGGSGAAIGVTNYNSLMFN